MAHTLDTVNGHVILCGYGRIGSTVASPYQIGAVQMAQTALRPAVVDFVELATSSDNLELAIEQVPISSESGLVGQLAVLGRPESFRQLEAEAAR